MPRRLLSILLAVAAPLIVGCGGGGPPSAEEVNSAVPPEILDLRGHLEERIRAANHVSAIRCHEGKGEHGIATRIYECDLTTEPTGAPVEVEFLADVSSGTYLIAECRTGPNRPYSQTPVGACRRIH
jgi:hypothetical protein